MDTYINVKVIEDSINDNKNRLITLQCEYPRFIHSQVMTHRMFSRNASSSRAIPTPKLIEEVRTNPVMPLHWGKNKPGMQADEELPANRGKDLWLGAAQAAADTAEALWKEGYHKQIVNRLLEPFLRIRVLITATEWDNFFNLRLHDDAQPEIQALAKAIKEAQESSIPRLVSNDSCMFSDRWHLPYVSRKEIEENDKSASYWANISAARCARVSYNKHDGTECILEEDEILANKLLESGHMSPFEHQACLPKPLDISSGNFRGWIQYRKLIEPFA